MTKQAAKPKRTTTRVRRKRPPAETLAAVPPPGPLPPPPEPPKGIVCPNCGCAHFYTLYTRRAWKGRLMRRRECRYCGRRITTHEEYSSAGD